MAAPGRHRGLRAAQRVPRRPRAGLARLAPGRRRGAGRPPRRPGPVAALAAARAGPARGRRRRLGGTAPSGRSGGEFFIAASAIPAVLGMILLVPVVLALRRPAVRTRLPLVLRYAVRDANRHRTRTVPAVAAVAATVAGVVALGIGLSSGQAREPGDLRPLGRRRRRHRRPTTARSAGPGCAGCSTASCPVRPSPSSEALHGGRLLHRGLRARRPDRPTELGQLPRRQRDGLRRAGCRSACSACERDVAPAQRALREGGVVAFLSPGRGGRRHRTGRPDHLRPRDRSGGRPSRSRPPGLLRDPDRAVGGPRRRSLPAAVRSWRPAGDRPAGRHRRRSASSRRRTSTRGSPRSRPTPSLYVERGYQT